MEKKFSKKNVKKNKEIKLDEVKKDNKFELKENKIINKNVSKNYINSIDVCTKLKKCSIDEISKYLLKQGKKKDFPDISKIN